MSVLSPVLSWNKLPSNVVFSAIYKTPNFVGKSVLLRLIFCFILVCRRQNNLFFHVKISFDFRLNFLKISYFLWLRIFLRMQNAFFLTYEREKTLVPINMRKFKNNVFFENVQNVFWGGSKVKSSLETVHRIPE